MKTTWIIRMCMGGLLCACPYVRAAVPVPDHPAVQGVLKKHYIPVTVEGSVDILFDIAIHLFRQDDILLQIQDAYARLLPPDEEPEFTVQQETPYRWSYVNRRNQHSVIEELYRDLQEEKQAELLYHTTGRRFFGEFEALTHVRLFPSSDGTINYTVHVYAYPKVSSARFLARHLRLIERYFASKADELTELTVLICLGIAGG